jgi:hypothetical protein
MRRRPGETRGKQLYRMKGDMVEMPGEVWDRLRMEDSERKSRIRKSMR